MGGVGREEEFKAAAERGLAPRLFSFVRGEVPLELAAASPSFALLSN